MSPRRTLAAAASAILLVLFVWSGGPGRLARRAQALLASATLDSNTRHLNGTVASGDRQFYVFLESARRRLPPGAPGVAVLGAPASGAAAYLPPYHFAPTRAVVAPEQIPAGWLVAVYGTETPRPAGWKVLAPVWKGVLMAPGP